MFDMWVNDLIDLAPCNVLHVYRNKHRVAIDDFQWTSEIDKVWGNLGTYLMIYTII